MKNEERLNLVANFYEKKLREVLGEEKFDEVVNHCLHLLLTFDLCQMDDGSFKDMMEGMVKPTKEDYAELFDLIHDPIASGEYEAWDPNEDDDLLDFDEEIEDDDDFDI